MSPALSSIGDANVTLHVDLLNKLKNLVVVCRVQRGAVLVVRDDTQGGTYSQLDDGTKGHPQQHYCQWEYY